MSENSVFIKANLGRKSFWALRKGRKPEKTQEKQTLQSFAHTLDGLGDHSNIRAFASTDESKEQSEDFDKKEIIQNEKDFLCLFNQTKYFFPEYVVPTLLYSCYL